MKKFNIYMLLIASLYISGCSTKEAAYNTATYIINSECETSKNCSGGFTSTYQENEKANEAYKKQLSKEKDAERLQKIQQELESKKEKK